MTLLRTSLLALVVPLAIGCTQETGDSSSNSSALDEASGEAGKHPRPVFADLVAVGPKLPLGETPEVDGDKLPPPHIVLPFHLPEPKAHGPLQGSPPPAAPGGAEGEKPKMPAPFCVVFKPEGKKPLPPPPGEKCDGGPGGEKPIAGDAPAAKVPRLEKIKADGMALPVAIDELVFEEGDGFALDFGDVALDSSKKILDGTEGKKPPMMHGPTILQIAVFDKPIEPKPGAEPQVPDAVLECIAPPGAPRIEVAPKMVSELLHLHRIEGAVARVAIAHFPPPPKGGPEGGKPPMGEGGKPPMEKPEGAPVCHPPVIGHGTFTMVPLHPKGIVMKPISL